MATYAKIADHSLATTSTGSVLAWGDNADGELGNGTTTNATTSPTTVSLPSGVSAVSASAGGYDSLALTSTGSVLSWGTNDDGQLGDGTTTQQNLPVNVQLPSGTTATQVVASFGTSYALTSTGTVLAWGDNTDGQLGNGSTSSGSLTPTPTSLPVGAVVSEIGTAGYSLSEAIVVPQIATSTTLTSTPNPAAFEQSVTFTASVTPTDDGGTVAFYADGSSTPIQGCSGLALSSSGGATCSISTLQAGNHSISATYSGDALYQSSSASLAGGQNVSKLATTTTLTASANPIAAGAPETLTATVKTIDGAGTVAFFVDGATTPASGCGSVSLTGGSGTYTAACTLSSLSQGTHSAVATYSGDEDYATSTGSLSGLSVLIGSTLTAQNVMILSPLGLDVTYVATLTRTSDGAPLAGQVVTFTTPILFGLFSTCQATTNSSGVAKCTMALQSLITGYSASFGGSATYDPSSGNGTVSLL